MGLRDVECRQFRSGRNCRYSVDPVAFVRTVLVVLLIFGVNTGGWAAPPVGRRSHHVSRRIAHIGGLAGVSAGWFAAALALAVSAQMGAPARRLRRRRSLMAEGSSGPLRVVGIGLLDEHLSNCVGGDGRDLFVRERHWRYTGNRWQFLGEQWDAASFWIEDRAGSVRVNAAECWFAGLAPDRIYNGAPEAGWRSVPRLGDTRVLRWSIREGQMVTAVGTFTAHPPSLKGSADGAPVMVLSAGSRARAIRAGSIAVALFVAGVLSMLVAAKLAAG